MDRTLLLKGALAMKVDFTFLHVDSSDALMQYTEERLNKIEKFELKPMEVHVQFSMLKHECTVDVTIIEGRRKFKAHTTTEDFYKSVDSVSNKLSRQMSKDKRRLKQHKNPEASHYGQLARLNEELESDFSKEPLRKHG
jgi:putative sigma-54 modulation protein